MKIFSLKRDKHGALELSITAIVVLIIAVTVLGLAIGFIKKQFGAGTELFTQEYSNIRAQMEEEMKSSGDLISFSFAGEADIGKPVESYLGIRNNEQNPNGDSVCFRVQMKCIRPFNPDNFCFNGQNDVVVGGYDMDTDQYVRGEQNWFRTLLGETDVRNFEAAVFPMEWLVRGAKPDSYSMELNVFKSPTNDNCADTGAWDIGEGYDLYATRRFTMTVV